MACGALVAVIGLHGDHKSLSKLSQRCSQRRELRCVPRVKYSTRLFLILANEASEGTSAEPLLSYRLQHGELGRNPHEIAAIRITVAESPLARASFEGTLW